MKKSFFALAAALMIASTATAGPIHAAGRLTGTSAVLRVAGKAASCIGKAAGKTASVATKAVVAVVKAAY